MATQEHPTYKIVLLGDGFVGKTALRERFMGRGFSSDYIMTIGADFAAKLITLPSYNKTVVFQIWDLAGQPRFEAVRDVYYRGSHGALLVYDVTRRPSFDNTLSWIMECWKSAGRQKIPFVLLGNKTDLRDQVPDCITEKEGHALAREISRILGLSIPYYETSALTGLNVNETFIFLGELIETHKKQIKVKKDNPIENFSEAFRRQRTAGPH